LFFSHTLISLTQRATANFSQPVRRRQQDVAKKTNVAAKKVVDKTAVKQSGKDATKSGVKVPFSKPWKAPPVKKKPNSWT
jgi:hypothetical protein